MKYCDAEENRMRLQKWMACAILLFAVSATAQTPRAETKDTAAIKQVLYDQEAAWNRGDIDTFMHGYKDSPDTTFIGKTISHGFQPILERYRKGYPSRAAMGTLDFSELTVRMLGSDHAVVTGRFHLGRTAEGGGDASGIFSLVFEHEADGWRIILDHTS
jgi:uncharacterized protein (TIGR02246 family)